MSKLTLITHVYNAQAGVDQHVAEWKKYSPQLLEHLEFIIIDDFSTPALTIDKGPLNLRHFRVNDDIDWNMPGCRNLGALHASSPWLLYFDVDNITTEQSIALLTHNLDALDKKGLHVFRRIHFGVDVDPHINTYLITRTGFFKAGGYDEDFRGHYGFEDVLFRNMWRRYVGHDVFLKEIAFYQMGYRTNNLERDLTRNQALINYKASLGLPKPQNLIRFDWSEVV